MARKRSDWIRNCIFFTLVCMPFSIISAGCGDNAAGGDTCDGSSILMNTVDEPAGDNCKWGGQKIELGLDADCNGVLSASEINTTRYNCNSEVSYKYTLENMGDSAVTIGFQAAEMVKFKLTDENGNAVPSSTVVLSLAMNPGSTASFSDSSVKLSTSVKTDASGVATAVIYTATTAAVGTLTAIATEVESNIQTVEIAIRDGSTVTGKGSLKVNLTNNALPDVQKALVKVYYIDSSDTTPYCDTLLAGGDVGFYDSAQTVKVGGGSGNVTFTGIDDDKRVVTFAKGQTSGGIDVGSNACAVSEPIVSDSVKTLDLVLDAPPVNEIDLDHGYDTLLHLNLASIMPATWQKWFNLVDDLFQSPTATGLYYALRAWEYRGDFATTGGGSTISYQGQLFGFNLDVNINVWDTVIVGSLGHDPTVGELMINCGMADGVATASCPTFSEIRINPSMAFNVGPYEVFKLVVELAEDKLAEIPGFGNVYGNIKTVGSNLTKMAKSFDVGARFTMEQTSETTVNVKEVWSHVVWTWQLFDDSLECDKNSSSYNAATCGRHAFRLSDGDLQSSVVNEEYSAVIKSSDDQSVVLELPSDHPFILRYGALVKTLINRVMVPVVMNHDADGLNSDGEPFTVTPNSNLGTLLNYWVPCTTISQTVYDWLIETLNGVGGENVNIGNLVSNVISPESLDGYCELGLNTASEYAMAQLDRLVADAKLNVRAGSRLTLTDFDGDFIPQTLKDLNYQVGVTVTSEEGASNNYNASITGEGILEQGNPPDPIQCADFLVLSDDAALAACL